MLAKAEAAFFAIADISGYTNFLAAVELDHAQDIIADFMDTVVKGLRPPFRLAKFEGDAAFVYALAEKVDGSLLQDAIEGAYFKFRRRLRDVKQASTCECQACAAMGNLDFKFVVHYGEMVKQKMGGREELAGRDVILVHRLLKNTISEKLGGRAYALYSDAALSAMGVDPAAQGLVAHQENIDVIGEVKLWARDLEGGMEAARRASPDGGDARRRQRGSGVRYRRAASDSVGVSHRGGAKTQMVGRRRPHRGVQAKDGGELGRRFTACTART